jgi:hypothetical protein
MFIVKFDNASTDRTKILKSVTQLDYLPFCIYKQSPYLPTKPCIFHILCVLPIYYYIKSIMII